MKRTKLLLGGVAAALLSLSACGDKSSTKSETENEKAPDPGATAPADAYPLKTCPVSGEELGSMGKPVVVTHEGTEVRLCCKECLPDFNKDPAKFVAMVKKGADDAN